MVLNQLSNLETTVGRFYINLPNRMIDLVRFSLPYTDPMGDGERCVMLILAESHRNRNDPYWL